MGELTPHVGFFRFPVIADDKYSQVMSWTNHVHPENSSNVPFSQTYTVEACGVEVKVPAGEFTTCRVRFVEASYPDIVPQTRWYDPDLDLVVKTDVDGVVYELWDYDLNASPLRFGSIGRNEHILSGNAAAIQAWTAPDGTPKATRYTSADGTVQVGTLYDADGLPELIVDEIDGWQIQVKSDAGDFGAWAVYDVFDKLGTYQGSWLVTDYEEDEGVMKIAEITGWDGTTPSLDNIQELPPNVKGFVDALPSADAWTRGGLIYGGLAYIETKPKVMPIPARPGTGGAAVVSGLFGDHVLPAIVDDAAECPVETEVICASVSRHVADSEQTDPLAGLQDDLTNLTEAVAAPEAELPAFIRDWVSEGAVGFVNMAKVPDGFVLLAGEGPLRGSLSIPCGKPGVVYARTPDCEESDVDDTAVEGEDGLSGGGIEPPEDEGDKIGCVTARLTKAPERTDYGGTYRYWKWEYEFVNSCPYEVEVKWHNRRPNLWKNEARNGWGGGSNWHIKAGDTMERDGSWSERDAHKRGFPARPPNPLTVWCVYREDYDNDIDSSDRCYGDRAYENDPSNWNEINW